MAKSPVSVRDTLILSAASLRIVAIAFSGWQFPLLLSLNKYSLITVLAGTSIIIIFFFNKSNSIVPLIGSLAF